MVGKNDSTRHTAPMGVEETSGGQPRPAQQPASEGRRLFARSADDAVQQSAPEQHPIMHSQRPTQDHKAPRGMLDRSLQAQLGRQLRAIYADIADEPVPERFIRLLEALAVKEKRR